VEKITSYNYPKELGKKIIQSWKNYKDLFGLETEVIKHLKDEGKSPDEITRLLEKRRQDIRSFWPDLKKEI
jgi:hypothetical protein